MRTISVRDLRQKWPEAERLLEAEKEIVVTRDGKPVARLIRISGDKRPRKRFDPAAQARWQKRTSGGRVVRWVDEMLRAERSDRNLD